MQEDFHYYATYCAAILAGYKHEDSLDICYCAQLVDVCSRTFLKKLNAPIDAATTMLEREMVESRTDIIGLQDITRIWASFHYLPYDLNATKPKCSKWYLDRYRLICKPNGQLVERTVEVAKDKPIQSVGIAMHVLADSWAHSYFAGTPSLVINNAGNDFFEIMPNGDERPISFTYNPAYDDDIENAAYVNSLFQSRENSVMNLGHGRAGNLPNYSFIKYRYVPAWNDDNVIVKDNPIDYFRAFTQMVSAMEYLKGNKRTFAKGNYDYDTVKPYADRIYGILTKRQLDASEDWKAFGEELSGQTIPRFNIDKYQAEYMSAPKKYKDQTFLGKFMKGALAQKGMVTDEIFRSGNILAGFTKGLHLLVYRGK